MKKSLLVSVLVLVSLFASLGSFTNAQDGLPARADLPEGWTQIATGGDTLCATGTDYSFFVHPAESDKLLIYFQGGGACWDGKTCAAGGTAKLEVYSEEADIAPGAGMFDFDDPLNPIADFNVVMVPYCTGDLHIGNADVEYTAEDGSTFTVYHRGGVNSQAVLNWVYENYPTPTQLVVTGCSAGAFGSILNVPFVMEHYANMPVMHFADSGAGVAKDTWPGIEMWDVVDNLPATYADLAEVSPSQFLEQAYVEAGAAFPDNHFAQYATTKDSVLTGFYFLMRGIGWNVAMQQHVDRLEAEMPNFYSYIAGGDQHCILPMPRFYSYTVDGVNFRDWFADLINGVDVASVHCQGDECNTPPNAD